MHIINRNIVANLLGQVGTALITIVATPFFFEAYGTDRYGVILLFTSLLTLSSFIDLGLGSSIIRVISVTRTEPDSLLQANRLLSWSMLYYFAISLLAGVALFAFADRILTSWATVPSNIYQDARLALSIWAFAITVRWPIIFVSGMINGLERYAHLNLITFLGTLFRTLVSLAIAHWLTLDIRAFSLVYLISTIGELLVMLYAAFAKSPLRIDFAIPDRQARRSLVVFSMGIAVSALVAWFIKMADKFIISGNVSIAEFSVYQTTFTLLSGFTLIAAAVTRAFYPQMSAIAPDPDKLAEAFHRATSLIVSITIPVAWIFVLNAELILSQWVRSPALGARWSPLFAVVCLGMAINSVMQLPQVLAWASGRSRTTATSNVVAVVFVVPMMLYLTKHYGAMGGAVTWLVYNFAYFVLFPAFAYRQAIGRGIMGWYGDVLVRSVIAILSVSLPFLIVAHLNEWLRLVATILGTAIFWIGTLIARQVDWRMALGART